MEWGFGLSILNMSVHCFSASSAWGEHHGNYNVWKRIYLLNCSQETQRSKREKTKTKEKSFSDLLPQTRKEELTDINKLFKL